MSNTRNPTARHRHNDVDTGTEVKKDKVVNVFKFFFFFIGFIYGIKASVEATENDLGSLPGVNKDLANFLSIYFYKSFPMLLLTAGGISQTGINLGLSIDIFIEFFKSLFQSKSNEIPDLLRSANAKNAAYVIGTLFGISSAITFMSYKNAKFTLPFGAEKNVPEDLMDISALFLLGGAFSNSCAYSVDGLREILYVTMMGVNKFGPKLVKLTPCPTFNLEGYSPDTDFTFANFFKLIGGIIGLAFAFNGSINLAKTNVEFPYVSHQTDEDLPLAFFNIISFIIISGLITNYFYHFGLALDKLVELIKKFPLSGSADDLKHWFLKYDIKDGSHVLGLLFGLALTITYINFDAKEKKAQFVFPFDAETGTPEVIMQMLMLFFLSGAYANAFSFFTDAFRQAVKGGKAFVHKASSVLPFSIFGSGGSFTPPPAPPLPIFHPNYPQPWLPYRPPT